MGDKDDVYFQRLLALSPAQFAFSQKAKAVLPNQGQEVSKTNAKKPRPSKKMRLDPTCNSTLSSPQSTLNAMDEKIKAKKGSKQKRKKKGGKETPVSGVSVQEMQDKLRARIAELQAKRGQGLSGAEQQEQKRLQRKQKRMNARSRGSNKAKAGKAGQGAPPDTATAVVAQRPTKPIVNKEGKMVFSKFDFTQTGEKQKQSSGLVGKDYKRLLARLEQRDAKVAKVKEVNPEAAAKLEQKHVWQDVLSKAKGEKVKDDPTLLKRAMKRKEKKKSQKTKKWEDRKETVEKLQAQRQEKRQKNLQKRKDDKKAKHRKKLVKKGRILPGF